MKVKRGEIYYIHKSDKQKSVGSEIYAGRPAVIVSNNDNNAFSSTFEVVYLTTQPKNKLPTHCQIYAAKRVSTALCEQVSTVAAERLGDYVGICNDFEMQKIDRAIKVSLGLDQYEVMPAPGVEVVSDSSQIEELIKVSTERDIYKNMYENLLKSMGVNV